MAAKGLDKFLLLMWKNWLLQWRHPLQTAVEIISPVLFSGLLVLIRSLVDPTSHPVNTFFNEFQINSTLPINVANNANFGIVYSPNNHELENVINNVIESMNLYPITHGFDNASDMNNFFGNSNLSKLVLCGVQFEDLLKDADKLPPYMNVTIRFPGESRFAKPSLIPSNWKTNFLFPLYQVAGPRQPQVDDGGYPPGYHSERFLAVQHHLSYAIINYFRGSPLNTTSDLPNITLQRYPYPPYIEDPLLMAMANFISIVIMLSFVYTCISTVKVITAEKEKQLKEAMKIMGLPNWLHWLAWFLKTLSFMLVSVIFIVILLKVQWVPGSGVSIFTNSDATVILFFLIIYMCTTITFCFMISVFFSRANIAATIAGLMWFVSYAPYLFLQQRYERLSLMEKLLACLGSNTAMAYGFQFMLMTEGTGEGLQWWTIFKSITPDDNFVLGDIMIMLIVDALIYLLIALYVEAVFPGEYGVPLPWYFPFTASYWCGIPRFVGVEDIATVPNGVLPNSEIYETEPYNSAIGVQIKHLRKEFRNKKVAVRDLCLNLYEGQITVLLGHNGAGKTTTMSMLTGMYPPTGGTAIVAGHDIVTDMPGVRASLGLCPQHNILFDDLTVEEHIYFFSKLKGLNKKEIDGEIQKYIKILELIPKAKALSKTLSGGMKRKLSVCVALCGNSKVVILDEPTAGMDPAARRALWDLLQEEKKNRTMLLSTHFMDEADLLGDRIAIMAGGTLQCCGSSFFLKKRYGTGYHLTMEKSLQCNAMKVTELLRKHIPLIQVESNVGSELTYLLSEEQLPVFEKMLKDLEENTKSLGVLNYGISLTTMEEVFMKVGADHGQEEEQDALDLQKDGKMDAYNDNILDVDLNRQSSESKLNMGDKLLSGFDLYTNQFRAMMMKKIYSTLRSWVLMIIQIIIPVTFLIIAIIVVRSWKSFKDLPPLEIKLSSYDHPYTVINGSISDTMEYKNAYVDYFTKTKNHLEDLQGKDLETYILKKSTENLPRVRLRYIVGASFENKSKIRAWFNNEPYHSSPLALNLVHNAILKEKLNSSYKGHKIVITNHPQPYTMDTRLNRLMMGNNIGFQIAFNIGFSMAFVSSFYIIFCVRERVSKAKHLQFVSGVDVFIFWISAYLWDIITFIFTSVCLVITLWLFQEDGFTTFTQIGRVLAALLLFGHAMLPWIYLASFFFDIPSTGYVRLTLLNIFTGVAGFLVVEVLSNPALDLKYVADILDWVFLFVPHYGISNAIRNLNNVYSVNQLCETYINAFGAPYQVYLCSIKNQCCARDESYFSWKAPGIGRNMVFFSVIGLVLFLILIIIEYRIPERIIYSLKGKNSSMAPPVDDQEDDDVAKERKKISSLSDLDITTHHLVLQEFSKYYNKFLAVQRLSVGVKGNECFGLLGVNGAGKTSTFKMLTGDEKISYGEAWVNGLSLKSKMKQVHQHIGYCPQFDALLDDLTGRETMTLFCLLRGVPLYESKFIVDKLAHEFGFMRHINKKVREYSGGNKRKLSTAVALIGDPHVVYLDEPTTGMDPAAKRYLWNALCKVRDSGKCIILTSHSMEECEALCTRIAIMVNGSFKCLGSTQHLKSKFSEGYTLTVKVKKQNRSVEIPQSEIDPIDKFIRDKYPSAILREQYQELLTYYISDTRMPWSQMFGIMEQGKKLLPIEDYSLGQASLEQVFLKFTKHQRSE